MTSVNEPVLVPTEEASLSRDENLTGSRRGTAGSARKNSTPLKSSVLNETRVQVSLTA